MPRYQVTVAYTMRRDIGVWADDEAEAEEKACDVVRAWKDVVEAEAEKVREE